MKQAITSALFFVFTSSVYSQTATTNVSTDSGSNCTPINCQASCNPGCATNTTCVLGTMKVCGGCPSSLCIDNSLLGLPMAPGNGNSDSGTHGENGTTAATNSGASLGMIGGIIGGLLGCGLLLVALGLGFMLWHKKQKSTKALPGHQKSHAASSSNMSSPGLSALPTTVSVPTLPVFRHQQHRGRATRISHYQGQSTISPANQRDKDSHPLEDDDDDDGRSSVSSVSHHGLASMVMIGGQQQQQQQGFPGARLKPQIMRLSTVRASLVNASLNENRTSSVRTTMLTPTTTPLPISVQGFTNNCSSNIGNSHHHHNISSATVSSSFSTIGRTASASSAETETPNNPFDDQHYVIDR